ncbi:hypothetical protein [Azotobacter vinelandii]|uniref:hypothetical protein n=1 Tax=Azotobacter vinelandii TaxID=354 RepID=UPI002666D122|nr:hypothetical protein [Azotobacter vinelandii]WKN21000.1 hypothetical protein AVAEIV_004048 [Azotobacter vinelandii]
MTDFQRCQSAATGSACPVAATLIDANLAQLDRAQGREELAYATGFAVGAALALETVGLLSATACEAATRAAKDAADARRLAWDTARIDAGLALPAGASHTASDESLLQRLAHARAEEERRKQRNAARTKEADHDQ